MFVRNHLIPSTKVVTLHEKDSLQSALKLMEEHGHDALPVLGENKKLVGLISKQYIYKVYFTENVSDKESFLTKTLVQELMKRNFRVVYEKDLLEAAIKQMTTMRMQFIVVLNKKDQFIGILTRRNLLEAMANALGMDKKGVRVEVVVNDMRGSLASLTKELARSGYNILSMVMIDPNLMDLQKVVMRLDALDEKRVVEILNDAGFKILNAVLE